MDIYILDDSVKNVIELFRNVPSMPLKEGDCFEMEVKNQDKEIWVPESGRFYLEVKSIFNRFVKKYPKSGRVDEIIDDIKIFVYCEIKKREIYD